MASCKEWTCGVSYIGKILNKEGPGLNSVAGPQSSMFNRQRRTLLFNRLLHFYWRFSRGLTLGVRGMVLDDEGRVFLIQHTYADGWHMPGGGVEAGETLAEALARELREEGNIELTGSPVLHGVFFHSIFSIRDHVAVYVVRAFRQSSQPVPNHEIAAHGFFPLDALPEGTTAGTRARIAEVRNGMAAPHRW